MDSKPTQKRFFVAIDIGKTVNCFAVFQDSDLELVIPPTKVTNNQV
jgi:hypothetical protein